jgi:hypothetical protein
MTIPKSITITQNKQAIMNKNEKFVITMDGKTEDEVAEMIYNFIK